MTTMRARPWLLPLLAPPLLALSAWAHDVRADDGVSQCIAASEQGLELRKAERLIDARKTLAGCATTRCPDEIRTVCEQRINDINGALPTVVFDVTDGAGVPQALTRLTVDGAVATTPLAGKAAPFNPGLHTFRFEVAGQPPLEKKVLLKEGDRDWHESVVIGPLAPAATAVAPPVAGPAPEAPPPAPPPSAPPAATQGVGHGQRIAGVVVGSLGVAGLAVGGVFGVMASNKWSNAQNNCRSGCGPNSSAQQDKNDASSAATVSTVAFIGGGALVVGGLVLFLTAPSGSSTGAIQVVPSAGPGEAALFLRGGF